MVLISTTVEGRFHQQDMQSRLLLVHYLRTALGRTGTVIGCDTSNCGTPPCLRVAAYRVPLTADMTQQAELAVVKGRKRRVRARRARCLIVCLVVRVAACSHVSPSANLGRFGLRSLHQDS
jgi:hypothetical protein